MFQETKKDPECSSLFKISTSNFNQEINVNKDLLEVE